MRFSLSAMLGAYPEIYETIAITRDVDTTVQGSLKTIAREFHLLFKPQ